MIQTEVTNEKILASEFFLDSSVPEHGAQIIFTGIVRNHNQGKKVMGVSYDAHPVLAKKVFQEISEEALEKWGHDLSVRIIHRAGRLAVGEVSLVIVVSSRHRDESYQASRYIIEEIKNRAPVWKKEHYEDGDSEWLQGHALCGHGPHEKHEKKEHHA
jgi:molybdopterin synthase catalytic subunit